MTSSDTSAPRPAIFKTALMTLGCALSLAFVNVPFANAGDTSALRPLDDQAPSLPLSTSFEKGTDPDVGPYILNIKNVSKDAIKISIKIHLSVSFHASTKDRNIPDHVIDPGQVWSVSDLAAGDKVSITSQGFAPLELTVP